MSQKKFTGAKLVIIGSAGVGKTAFAVRYITKRYIGDYDSKKEMVYTHKIPAGRDEICLEVLDSASDAPLETVEKNFKWGDGFVFMYSVTDKNSFQEACRFKDLLLRIRGQGTPAVLVANKCDLITARNVTEDDGLSLAEQLDCPKYEISVADGTSGVSEAMEEILIQTKREFVKSLSMSNMESTTEKPRSKLFKVLKKRIGRSHSDTV